MLGLIINKYNLLFGVQNRGIYLLSILVFVNILLYLYFFRKASSKGKKNKIKQIAKEIEKLKKDKEVLEVKFKKKTIELATKSKENRDKMILLEQVRTRIDEDFKVPNSLSRKWNRVKKQIDYYLVQGDKTFEIQIDQLHKDFYKLLRSKYPDLTTYDLRLAVYLKMGLNSREISKIMKVLPSSINVSRSRLRKKLNLKPEENLYVFFHKIQK